MKTAIAAALLASVGTFAAPLEKRAVTDVEILNYALTLEHLEAYFYKTYLGKYDEAAFKKMMHNSKKFRTNLNEIAADEAEHVTYLTNAIKAAGGKPVAACDYSFPVTSVDSFLAVAAILEGVGTSAYLGAAHDIANKAYLTAAGSILTVEARHTANLRSHENMSPYPAPFETPLDFDEVYTLASEFITKCPSSNTQLPPLKAFTGLTGPKTPSKPGQTITVTAAKKISASKVYYTWAGASSAEEATPVGSSGKEFSIKVPTSGINGQSYALLTSSSGAFSDSNVLAGPAIVEVTSAYEHNP